jgi:uncharacterized delta-60 repeat protein
MRGSLVVTFDEFFSDLGGPYYTVVVNGNETYRAYYGMSNLYSSNINIGDVVTVSLFDDNYDKTLSISRTDYTTDDENGDRGIKTTNISSTSGITGVSITFTATTRNDAYGFEYKVDSTVQNCLNIQTGFNQGLSPFGSYAVREVKLINNKIYCMGNFAQYQGIVTGCFTVLNNNGSIDPTFPLNVITLNAFASTIEQQSDGKVLLGGSFTTYSGVTKNGIVRINNNYSIDNTFVTGTGFGGAIPQIYDLEIQPDGKILAGGNFTSYNGTSIRNICRLNSNGSIDTSFSGNTNSAGSSQIITDISLYSDGKMLISGDFLNYNNVASADKIVRLNSDGSIDGTFTSPFAGTIGTASNVLTTEILSDGKIMIGGIFDFPISGSTSYGLARLNSNGSLDTTFTTDTYFVGEVVTDFYVLPDNKILMLVTSTSPDIDGLYRLNSDGSLDTTFNPVLFDQTFSATQESIAVRDNGNIIVGGGFVTVNGNTYRKIFECDRDGNLLMCDNIEIELMTELSESITTENELNLIIDL